ncbi:MAG: hypothetical protein ABR577_07545 [Pyrinomonadaceae bacterium]
MRVHLRLDLFCYARASERAVAFYTDDADVTAKRKFHFQFGNEYDILQRSAYPGLRQNTAAFELDYGLLENVEIGVDAPLIAISNAHGTNPRLPFGYGDTDFHVKYNFYKEREASKLPAMTVNLSVEIPTGNSRKQLGLQLGISLDF